MSKMEKNILTNENKMMYKILNYNYIQKYSDYHIRSLFKFFFSNLIVLTFNFNQRDS